MREPYQIILDPGACQESTKHKINFRDVLPNVLGGSVKLLSSPCIISELKNQQASSPDDDGGSVFVAKRCELLKCKHYPPKSAKDCIFDLIHTTNNQYHYGVLAQDEELRKNLGRNTVGVPIFHIYAKVIVMEDPSDRTLAFAREEGLKASKPASFEMKMLEKIAPVSIAPQPIIHRRRKAKGPNPLSCKKPTKKNVITNPITATATADNSSSNGSSNPISKPKRKRKHKSNKSKEN